jgi:hypothetical protein
MSADPWVEPPVSVVVPAVKRIPGWGLGADPNHPDRKQTPPLPDSHEPLGAEFESLSLVPYGATHLRLSIFPQV